MGRVGSILVTASFAVAAVGVVAVPTTHALGGTISGVVRDTGGNPIAGATVSLQPQANMFSYPSFTTTTDATGAYTISGVGPGTSEVLAFAPGFAMRVGNAATFETGAPVVITADETHTFDVTLPRKNASISGTVTNPDGNPIANATVRAMYKGSSLPSFMLAFDSSGYFGFTTTDADGHYVIADMAPTVFTIDFSPVDSSAGPPPPTPYLEEWYLDSRSEAGATTIELSEGLDTALDAQLELGATISGRVTDPAGNPVAGAVVISPANVTFGGPLTDADGRYTMIGVPPGDLAYVTASPEGTSLLPGYYGGANFDTATHLQVGLGQVIEGIDIQLATPGNVNVAVFRPDGSLAPSVIVPCIAPGVPVVVPSPAPTPGFGPGVECTSGGKVSVVGSPGGGFRIPVGTYNAISAEGIGGFGVTTLNPSDVATFTLTADTPIDCVFHLGGAASCTAAGTATNDGDGVPASIEDAAPNGGDGDNDGTRDATQSNVASLPAAIGGGYVMLVVADGLRITGVIMSNQSAFTQPMETGAIGIVVEGLAIGGTADITILRTTGGAATELWSLNHQTFQYSAVPADFSGSTIVAHIVDGDVFDNQNQVGPFYNPPDGAISAFLTPVIPDHTPPSIACPSPEPVFAVQQYPATITATVTDTGSGVVIPPASAQFPPLPALPPFSQTVDTFTAGPGSVTFTASDKVGNTATATCHYMVVDDGDGVPPSIETGDGNGDGIADAIQPNVATASMYGYAVDPVVIASPTGTQLTNVSLQPSQFYPQPSGQPLGPGVISSTISGMTPGHTIDVDLIQTAAHGNVFLQYTGSGWIPLPATFNGPRLTVSVTDGGLGDNDRSANGSISLSGAVATGETIPPTITCAEATPTFRRNQAFAFVIATASDAESGVADSILQMPVDTSILGPHSVTFVAVDLAGNQATQACDYIVVDDGDGVPVDVENAAPNNGDGNYDGIPDSEQSYVASLPEPIGGGYATIVSSFGDLSDVSATNFAGTPAVPPQMRLESGLYRFTANGSLAWINMRRTTGSTNIVFVSPIGGTWQQVSSVISDGGFGDADGVVNGQVLYVVAPAVVDTTPPTITCPAPPSFLLNRPRAKLSASVSDGDSGVAASVVTVRVPTSTVGPNDVAVSASDRAGNTATVSCSYSVGVRLTRLISPNPARTTIVKAGRPIPISWRAVDFYWRPVSDPNHFVGVDVTASSCVTGRVENLGPVRDRGLRYLGNGRWEFDWTSPATKGCYTLQLSLTGASKTAHIKVK